MLQRVMLVEDSEGEALLVQQRLRTAGFGEPIYHISDCEEALRYFQGEGDYRDRRRYPLPEILLLDLAMPGIDGYQLVRWIRTQPHLASLIVVALTAELDTKKIGLAYQLGVNTYLSKNGTDEEFVLFVRFLTSFARLTRHLPTDFRELPLPTPLPMNPATPSDSAQAAGAD